MPPVAKAVLAGTALVHYSFAAIVPVAVQSYRIAAIDQLIPRAAWWRAVANAGHTSISACDRFRGCFHPPISLNRSSHSAPV